MIKRTLILILAILAISTFPGCIHQDFDEPPAGGSDPEIDAGLIRTIADIKALYNGGDAVEITDSVFITGIVIADDKSGNFYQTVVIQDESAGISIRIGLSDFFNIYPVGRRVFVYVKGLYIGQYADLVQIGVKDIDEPDGVERIPNFLVEDYFYPGEFNLTVDPIEATIAELNSNRIAYQNMLIKLLNVEVGEGEVGESYADAVNQQTVNRMIYDCNNRSIILRNSGYASFAAEIMPEGNGSLTAVFSIFADDNQLLIRDSDDLDFDNVRCNEQPIVCDPVDAVTGTSEDFQTLPLFDPVDHNGWKSISVVGNEPWEGRSFSGNSYPSVQGFNSDSEEVESWLVSPKVDFDEAQELTFLSKIGYWTHNGLNVFISQDFDGCNIRAANWTELGSALIADEVNSPDGVGAYANFFINSGVVDLSGYSGDGYIGFRYIGDNTVNTTTYQLDDISIGEEPPIICDLNNSISEDFETASTSGAFSMDCWQNVATIGSELWEGREFSSNRYPQIDGFNSNSADIETYLITPEFDLSMVSTLSFETKVAFCEHEGLTVYISTDYDGSDVGGATWNELSATLADINNSPECDGGYGDGFISSGDVDLSSFSGTGYIAFVYRGDNTSETTTYQVDNVSLQ